MIKQLCKQTKQFDGEEHEEYQYINTIKSIIDYGSLEEGRNGNTLSIFGTAMHFSLENNVVPFITTKRLAWKTCLKELLWFIKGSTDNNELVKQNVHIWDGNSSKEYLNQRNLKYDRDGDLGPIYGHQWRYFNAPYEGCDKNYKGQGVDQLQNIIESLKDPTKRNSRRLVLSSWNPSQLDEMALPPCHIICQFFVTNKNKLSCSLYQRSGDVGLGVPFNIASYSMLTILMAKHCDLIPFEFIYTIGCAHIYDDHVEPLKEHFNRKPYPFPTLQLFHKYENIEDYKLEDFKLQNYKSYDSIKMQMRT